jgi:hypothetical protein
VEIGLSADVPFISREDYFGDEQNYANRVPLDVSLVVGAIGFLSDNIAIDVRYSYAFNKFSKVVTNSYLYQGSIGLNVFF